MKVGVIGAGVMGEALIAALISYGVSSQEITISEKRKERADELESKYSIRVDELSKNVASSQILLLVVKPQDMAAVLAEIKNDLSSATTVVSFAAGKKIAFIADALGTGKPGAP